MTLPMPSNVPAPAVLRFLLRVRAWEYRQLPKVYRVNNPTRPDKARRLGYKAKQVCDRSLSDNNTARFYTAWGAGLRYLPRGSATGLPQAARLQGHCVRQAQAPGTPLSKLSHACALARECRVSSSLQRAT
jgi:hypothetical protein